MLDSAEIAAIIPVSDIDRALEFYEQKLGFKLEIRRDHLTKNREAEFSAAGGALVVYESVAAGQSKGTAAAFRVDDLQLVVAELQTRGVVFEEYDTPELKTVDGIGRIGDLLASWCKDPDGNIIAIEQRTES